MGVPCLIDEADLAVSSWNRVAAWLGTGDVDRSVLIEFAQFRMSKFAAGADDPSNYRHRLERAHKPQSSRHRKRTTAADKT
jgi:hypothetical protein